MNPKITAIMNIMDTIEYGFKDKKGNNIIDADPKKWDEEFDDFYYLQEPEELLDSKCGVCWDQVELERKLFAEAGMPSKTYFIYITDGDMLPSHTFLSYEENGQYYWFESSWRKHKGIHEYNSEHEMLEYIAERFREDHPEVDPAAPLFIYEYGKPKKHIRCNEFYRYIETQKPIELA